MNNGRLQLASLHQPETEDSKRRLKLSVNFNSKYPTAFKKVNIKREIFGK